MAMATCKIAVFDLTLGWGKDEQKFSISQDMSALIIVALDMLIILIFVFFIFSLDQKQNNFAELYKDYSI